jgi:hypothetical protein
MCVHMQWLFFCHQACTICQQRHGSCIHCAHKNCRTSFHTMCGFRAGYHMEMCTVNKSGAPLTRMNMFCSTHRTPNPDTFLVLKSPQGKTLKKELQQAGGVEENAVNSIAGGGYISGTHQSSLEHCASDNLSSAARCHPYTTHNKGAKVKRRGIAIAYRATGFSWNSVENINSLRVKFEFLKISKFSTDR